MTGKSVLVVEDHDLNRQLLTMLVEQHGHEARGAASVAEVHERLGEGIPDVILMDVHLPDGDGLDLTRELRGRPELEGVRIYAVTAYLMGETEQRATAAGADGLFEKPIDTAKLLPALNA